MEKNQKETIKKPNISLILDSYNDIFSDFDPRKYSERALSDDFLSEVRRASRDKPSGEIELNFLIPKNKRSVLYESLIKKRLKEHFKKHYALLHNETNSIRKKGGLFVFFGILTMFIATLILHYAPSDKLLYSFLVILFEPGGWFLFWEGLSLIIFKPNEKKAELEFYNKMSKASINFNSYE